MWRLGLLRKKLVLVQIYIHRYLSQSFFVFSIFRTVYGLVYCCFYTSFSYILEKHIFREYGLPCTNIFFIWILSDGLMIRNHRPDTARPKQNGTHLNTILIFTVNCLWLCHVVIKMYYFFVFQVFFPSFCFYWWNFFYVVLNRTLWLYPKIAYTHWAGLFDSVLEIILITTMYSSSSFDLCAHMHVFTAWYTCLNLFCV